jgi:hypothetical protein
MRDLAAVLACVAAVIPIGAAFAETSPVNRFSIAGAYIGEKPADALNALKGEGYRIATVSQSDSFKQRLSDARNTELRRPFDKVRATDVASVIAIQADQRIRINFDDDAAGSRVVSSIYYQGSFVAHPFDRVRRTMVSRYGHPQAEDGTGPVWCTRDPPGVCLAHGVHGDRLKVGHDYRGFDPTSGPQFTTIELGAGNDLLDSWREGFHAALARLLKSTDAF